jgi:hypothetical protein
MKWDRGHNRRFLVPVAPDRSFNVRGRVKVPLAPVKSGCQGMTTVDVVAAYVANGLASPGSRQRRHRRVC